MHRHKRNHLPAHLAKAREARELADADALLSQVESLRDRALSTLDRAEVEGDLRTEIVAIREARSCVELLSKLLFELRRAVRTITAEELREIQELELAVFDRHLTNPAVFGRLGEAEARRIILAIATDLRAIGREYSSST